MTDVLTAEQRKLNMSRIRGQNTNLELLVRRLLHAKGFRYQLHRRDLPGRPDIVLPKYRVCIFVHGCFWHGHACSLFRLPETRRDFWEQKIAGNRARDARAIKSLLDLSWRVLTIWECSLRGPNCLGQFAMIDACASFLCSDELLGASAGVLP